MAFPTSVDSFPTKVDGVTTIVANDENAVQNAVVAIEQILLNTQPAGADANVVKVFNVQAGPYGAKGDGVTDDTAAFNNAIIAAGTLGVVFVPQPVNYYLISGTINNSNHIPILVMGQALFGGAGAPTANIIRFGISGASLFVASTGSDSNPGTAALPFLTLQRAVNVASTFAGGGIGSYIYVASGSYAGFVYSSNGLSFNASGNNAAPAGIVISGGNGGGITTITKGSGLGCITVNGAGAAVTLQGTITFTSTGTALFTDQGGMIIVNSTGITFGACTLAHMHADRKSAIEIGAGYTISGNAPSHLETTLRGFIGYNETAMTVTLTGSPVFSTAFAYCQAHGTMYIPASFVTFSGAAGATTIPFLVKSNSMIETNNGAAASYLPGTVPGQCIGGGRYSPMGVPILSGLTGCGSTATMVLRGGNASNDFDGVIEINNSGTGSTAIASLTITPATGSPGQMQGIFIPGKGTASWDTRAIITITAALSHQAITITIDNNGVTIPTGTLEIYYHIQAS